VRSPKPANTETPPVELADIVDQLHDQDRLANPGTTEGAHFPPFKKGQIKSMTLIRWSATAERSIGPRAERRGRWIG